MLLSHEKDTGNWRISIDKQLVDVYYFSPVYPNFQVCHSAVFIRAISLTLAVCSPFTLPYLNKLWEVLMLCPLFSISLTGTASAMCPLWITKREIISVIPLSYHVCWCHKASCKQVQQGNWYVSGGAEVCLAVQIPSSPHCPSHATPMAASLSKTVAV